jgi:hypothetical protein
MKIKLNNESFELKHAEDLTINEYLLLSKLDSVNIINYISTVLGIGFATIADLKFSERDIKLISAYVGSLKSYDYFNTNSTDSFYFGFTGETFYRAKITKHETIGTRMLLEQFKSDNIVELATYLLAIIITNGYDFETVQRNYERLLSENYIRVLSFAAFFLRNFKSGLHKETKSSKLQIMMLLKNIAKKLRRLTIID